MTGNDALPDGALTSPAALRNRDPILDVLRPILPPCGTILELASGTGEHVLHLARHLPQRRFQPSDPSADARRSIAAWAAAARLPNLLPPLAIDAMDADWAVGRVDAIIAINMVHISPWAASVGLMAGAARHLGAGGLLYLYGPFREIGIGLAPSNLAFDQDLKARNPAWGLRSVEDLAGLAAAHGLTLEGRSEMPANNLSLWFRRL
jgi:SAM-dependent methyltransferase